MTGAEALTRLGEATARAVLGTLEELAPGQAGLGDVRVLSGDSGLLEGLPTPAVATSATYAEGASGAILILLPLGAARRLAPAIAGDGVTELSEPERSAVSEAAGRLLGAAAATLATMLDAPVELGPLQTRTLASAAEAAGAYPATPFALTIGFTVGDEPCRLVQLVPNALVVRTTEALHELGSAAPSRSAQGDPGLARDGRPSLDGIPVRVWAELGRTRMPSEQFVGLPPGAVVELDRHPDDPVDLFVNGRRFATGRLVVVDDAEWAVRIETIVPGEAGSGTPS